MASSSETGEDTSPQHRAHFSTLTESDDDDSSSESGNEEFVQVQEAFEPPPKKIKSEWSKSYSDKAMQMMKSMGYREDKGLGKMGQGRLEPIEASKQEGRRGLGLKLDDLSNAAVQWDPSLEEITMPERIDWLRNNSNDLDNWSMEDIADLVRYGPKKLTIDDETKFCDPEILENILKSKSAFDNLGGSDMRMARTKSNPFETIRGSIFLNRAAVKMANIDSLCDFMFTNPVDENGRSLVKDNDLLYFADICAGPGGFSEYVLYKKSWEAKGFGFTLKGKNDFKLENFFAGSPETFDAYYGVKDDGNIFDPDNQESLQDYVLKHTDTGVHFVMADGGFSVEGQENVQEILSKQLYLCQCLVALSLLREKGHFVCKLFDLFTPFSVGLVYLMWKCFEEISICKPNTSRPANSERYLICKWKKPNTETIRRHLFQINQEMFENPDSDTDVTELVSTEVLFQDKEFIDYITENNNRFGKNQIVGLVKIAAFYQDPDLKENRQAEFRKKCLELWQLPDRARQAPDAPSNESLLAELLQDWRGDKELLQKTPAELKSQAHLDKHIRSIYDWYFVPVGREDTCTNVKTLFLCKGRGNVLALGAGGKWESVDCCLEVSARTLIYGEIVTELIGEARSQNKVSALHIIDGIVIGGKDIRRYPLKERLKLCDKFARSLNKPYKVIKTTDGNQKLMAPIRCKRLFALKDINDFFDQMRLYKLKEGPPRLGFRIRPDDGKAERFYVPGGLLFFNELNPPYMSQLSKSRQKFYYFNYEKNESHFVDCVPKNVQAGLFASFRCTYYHRLIWRWTMVYQVEENVPENRRDSGILFRDDFRDFILRRIK